MTDEGVRSYPTRVRLGGREFQLRLMDRNDREALLAFARSLPEHDLLFLRRDITEPATVNAWIRDIERGVVVTILASSEGRVVGYGTVHRSEIRWSAHVAELRVMVAEEVRGKGLGRVLTQEAFATALTLGLEKIVAQMTLDQKGAIAVFQGMGFRPEALLRDQVKDRDGNKHDLLVLSHEVARFEAHLAAYGLTEAFEG